METHIQELLVLILELASLFKAYVTPLSLQAKAKTAYKTWHNCLPYNAVN
jgi:hypothetical protein